MQVSKSLPKQEIDEVLLPQVFSVAPLDQTRTNPAVSLMGSYNITAVPEETNPNETPAVSLVELSCWVT